MTWIRIGLAPWIRILIRIEAKSWIWIRIGIRIETNTDPKHWLKELPHSQIHKMDSIFHL
jgi:hypothetical protein